MDSSEYGIPTYSNCHIEGKNYRCVRLLSDGDARFVNCDFDGHQLYTSQQYFYLYGNLYLDTCSVDASDGRTIQYGIKDLGSGVFIESRWTTFEHYNRGVETDENADFGTLSDPGHNCFLDNDGYAIYNSGNYTITAQWNYFDTLLFYGTVVHDSTDALCEPDTSLHKIYTASGKPSAPKIYTLGPAVPNPFNSSVEISFEIPEKTNVELAIYDVTGHIVKYIISAELEAGSYRAVWNGKSDKGKNMPSGVYLYRLRCDNFDDTKKMTLIR